MTILDASTDAAVIIDTAGSIVKVNKACERMFGYAQADLTGKNVKLLMPEPYSLHHDSYIERFHRTHVGHIGVGRQLLGLRANGETFEMFLTLTEVKDADKHFFCGFVKNIAKDGAGSQLDLLATATHSDDWRPQADSADSADQAPLFIKLNEPEAVSDWTRGEFREINMAEVRFLSQTPLGKGAFGVVFAGEWRGLRVAVKKLMGYLDDQMLENMRSECALMHKCSSHPNIVKFIGAGSVDSTMCIVSQYCSNGSVFDAIVTHGIRFSPRETMRMLRDAALGVMHLHKESVVHRDIAARNVLLDEFYNVYLCDFGLARVKTQAYHHTKSSLGPVNYLSPEAISKKQYSFASDVYSFGVLMWEMTHFAEPYADQQMETFEIAMGVVNGTLRLAIDEQKSLGLGDMMRACWSAVPNERPLFDQLLSLINQRLIFYSRPPPPEQLPPAAPAPPVEAPAPVEPRVVPIVTPSIAEEERN